MLKNIFWREKFAFVIDEEETGGVYNDVYETLSRLGWKERKIDEQFKG
jgi:hypothetical protein